ncbi:MAG TPA: hypothetical protein PKY96_13510 [Flavobacteriales bacterium]|nr:hypothetical protein [Flavobacteriales bacterium]
MLSKTDSRSAHIALSALILLSMVERVLLLLRFGFTHIGIDDALIQQVAIDYGQGLFREPFLYGQNYNPMLEALLAAPFVRLGATPWIALPIVTSLLGLLPFWSFAIWCMRRGAAMAAFVLAAAPLLMPVEWGMITSLPRGWVHGLALLAFIPWLHDLRNRLIRYGLISLTLVAALLCNPNAAPLAFAIGLWLVLREGRTVSLWLMGLASLTIGWALHSAAQGWYSARPGSVVHPLMPDDLAFDPALMATGLARFHEHVLYMHPFGSMGWLSIALLMTCVVLLVRRREWPVGLAIMAALLVMLLALGLPKTHEGCASIFLPLSRLMLCLPLLMAIALAWLLRDATVPRWLRWALPSAIAIVSVIGSLRIESTVRRELAQQECAWVREEPLEVVRNRCKVISGTANAFDCDVIVPVRWPHLKVDHRAHFAAHFTCYACPQLVPGMTTVHGAGFDRRSWIRSAHEAPPHGRVLFVGGDERAWSAAIAAGRSIEAASDQGILLHIAQCDTIAVGDFILQLGIDDDLGR